MTCLDAAAAVVARARARLECPRSAAILRLWSGWDFDDRSTRLWFLLSKKVRIDWEIVGRKMQIYDETVDAEKLLGLIERTPVDAIRNDLKRFLPMTHRTMVGDLRETTLKKLRETGDRPGE
ncbi:MAG: hypothetical protein ABIJ56_03215 [Pseudomonadota bacterium]